MLKTNFSYFTVEWELFNNLGESAEQSIYRDPNAAIVKIRSLAEKMTDAIFKLEGIDPWGLKSQVEKLNTL